MGIATDLSPAHQLAHRVVGLMNIQDMAGALELAREGWRDYPVVTDLPHVKTFASLAAMLAGQVPGGVAEPAPLEEEPVSVAPVSAVPVAPVSAVPVSVAPVSAPVLRAAAPNMPVSAAPVSAPAAPVQTVTIERTAAEGTIIRVDGITVSLRDVLMPLGWNWAKRGWFYLGDRDTAPDMVAIGETAAALQELPGIDVVSTVRGDEPARPVSAPPARPVSAAPVRKPTRRERAVTRRSEQFPVTVRQVSAPPAAPVSAVPVSAAPVSAVPAAPVAPVQPDALTLMVQQMAAMQAQLAALVSGGAVPAAAPAPVVPVVQVPAVPAPLSAELVLAELVAKQTNECMGKTWTFKLSGTARTRHTATELREQLRQVSDWWAFRDLGKIGFEVRHVGNQSRELIVTVTSATGDIKPTHLSKQVVGVALVVKGISGQVARKAA